MPSNQLDCILAVASEVFGRAVAPGDSFFNLGGDSVTLVEFTMRLEEATGIRLDLGLLFEKDTIAQVALLLEESDDSVAR